MRSYTMTDLAFADRWQAALQILSITFMEIEKHLAKLQMVGALWETGPYLHTLMKNNGEDVPSLKQTLPLIKPSGSR